MRKRSAAVILPVLKADLRRTWGFGLILFIIEAAGLLLPGLLSKSEHTRVLISLVSGVIGLAVSLGTMLILFLLCAKLFDHYSSPDRDQLLRKLPLTNGQIFRTKSLTALILTTAAVLLANLVSLPFFAPKFGWFTQLTSDWFSAVQLLATSILCCTLADAKIRSFGVFLLTETFALSLIGFGAMIATRCTGFVLPSSFLTGFGNWIGEHPYLNALIGTVRICLAWIPAFLADRARFDNRARGERVFRWLPAVCSGLTALALSNWLSSAIASLFSAKSGVAVSVVFCLTTAVVFAILLLVVKSVRAYPVRRTVSILAAVVAVCAVAIIVTPILYERIVPAAEDIAFVQIDDGSAMTTERPAEIADAVALMRTCIRERGNGTDSVGLTFRMKDGRQIIRRYSIDDGVVSPDSAKQELDRLLRGRADLIPQLYGAENIGDVSFTALVVSGDVFGETPVTEEGAKERFARVYAEDVRNGLAPCRYSVYNDSVDSISCQLTCSVPYRKLARFSDGTLKLIPPRSADAFAHILSGTPEPDFLEELNAEIQADPDGVAEFTLHIDVPLGSQAYNIVRGTAHVVGSASPAIIEPAQ